MFKFLKESIREFKHVVWPTHAETKKFFSVVVIMLVLFGLYLFIANTVFAEILQTLRDIFQGSNPITPEISLENISTTTSTGEVVNTASGEVINISDVIEVGESEIVTEVE